MRTSISVLMVLVSIFTAVPRVSAQTSHAAAQSVLDSALQQKVAAASADRDAVRRVLAHPEVQAVADKSGIDLRRVNSAIATLDPQELVQIASQARQVESSLSGGQSRVVISTTVIIIALLVLILIIVAVD